MIRTLIIAAGAAAFFQTAAEDLDGFALAARNEMTCQPQSLSAAGRLRILVPKGTNYEMLVFTPAREFIELVQPPPAEGFLYTSDQLKPGATLVVQVSKLYGLQGVDRKDVFVQPGHYIFMIGGRFDTETPIVNGWCRVSFHAPGLTK